MGVVQRLTVRLRRLSISDGECLAPQRVEPHKRRRLNLELEFQRQNRFLECGHIRKFRTGGNLYHHAVLQIWAEQTPSATLNRGPGVWLQGPARNQRIAAARKDPTRRVLPQLGQIFGEKPVDVWETRPWRNVVQHNYRVLILKDRLERRYAH